MKKLLLAFVVLVGLGSAANAQSKLGHVDLQLLWDTIPSSQAAAKKLQDFENDLITELKEMQLSLQKDYQDYQAMMNSPEPPSEMRRQIMEQNISKKEQDLQERQRTMQLEMQIRQAELEEPLTNRIKKAINIVAERQKLSYVLDVNTTIYSAGGMDITDAVVVELLKLEAEATSGNGTTPGGGTGQ